MAYINERLTREKIFRDPVHNYIYIQHCIILDLINTKEFQRLRRIKQLGTTSMVFHGAEHTRFTHSLGVYEITRRICDNFSRNYPTKTLGDGLWDDSERIVALCAALLHDIGHGPYSHTFEHIFKTNHESITVNILTSSLTEINAVLRSVSPEFPQKVASVIEKTYPNQQVVQLISSQIDADRMDYLLRDAYHTGTQYGMFDLTQILRVMRPYHDGIAFEINGMHAVEDYIVSRFQMYQQIYFHPVSRAMEVILNHLLERACEIYKRSDKKTEITSPYLLFPFFRHEFNLDNYLILDDGTISTYIAQWRQDNIDPILSDLAHRFLDRKPLKSVRFNQQTEPLISHLQKLIIKAGFNINFYTAINNSYDIPYDAYNSETKKTLSQIELIQSDGNLIELSSVSTLVNAITGKFTGDQRFFFPKEMLSKNIELFEPIYNNFQQYLHNDQIIQPQGK